MGTLSIGLANTKGFVGEERRSEPEERARSSLLASAELPALWTWCDGDDRRWPCSSSECCLDPTAGSTSAPQLDHAPVPAAGFKGRQRETKPGTNSISAAPQVNLGGKGLKEQKGRLLQGQQTGGRTILRQQHEVLHPPHVPACTLLSTAGVLSTALHTQTELITVHNKMCYKMAQQ